MCIGRIAVGFIDWLDRRASQHDGTMLNFPVVANAVRLPQTWITVGLSHPRVATM
jgi:hypothetical protein